MANIQIRQFELDSNQMQDNGTEEVGTNYEHCTTSGPIQVHTCQGRTATINPEQDGDEQTSDTVERPNSYLELDSTQIYGTENVDITNYEHCTALDPRPVHTYERRMDVIKQEEGSADLEPKVSEVVQRSYDQLKSIPGSEPPKPPVYEHLQIEQAEPIISP